MAAGAPVGELAAMDTVTSRSGDPRPTDPSAAQPQSRDPAGPLLAADEYDACVEELDRLRRLREQDLPDRLRAARAFVASDAAEESIQIREDHAVIDARIARLEQLLRTARVVADDAPARQVALGRTVEVEWLSTGRVAGYRIAGIPGAPGDGTVSAASPIGRALLGRSQGDVVTVELPRGRTDNLRILAVRDGAAERPAGGRRAAG